MYYHIVDLESATKELITSFEEKENYFNILFVGFPKRSITLHVDFNLLNWIEGVFFY